MSDISLSKGIRANLLSLQKTSGERTLTQERLATGKKVNSALDNPVNYFTSQSLSVRATDLSSLLDGISNGIQTLQAASKGIDGITKLVQSAMAQLKTAITTASATPTNSTSTTSVSANLAKTVVGGAGSLSFTAGASIKVTHGTTTSTVTISTSDTLQDVIDHVNSALNSDGLLYVNPTTGSLTMRNNTTAALSMSVTDGGSGTKTVTGLFGATGAALTSVTAASGPDYSSYITAYNTILNQISGMAQDSSYNGKNLLNSDTIGLIFNEKSQNPTTLNIKGMDATFVGLGLTTLAANSATTTADLNGSITKLNDSLSLLRQQSSVFGANLAVVQARSDFTRNLVNTLQTGSDNLILADQNEEGANMLSLQTRQQLSTTALSLANQADQGVLKLFG
jgi:flagellin